MRCRSRRTLARRAVVAAIGLASIAGIGSPAAARAAVSITAGPGCSTQYGSFDAARGWQLVRGMGGPCRGEIVFTRWNVARGPAVWYFWLPMPDSMPSFGYTRCQFDAFFPSWYAGNHAAQYAFWAMSDGWWKQIGSRVINQEPLIGRFALTHGYLTLPRAVSGVPTRSSTLMVTLNSSTIPIDYFNGAGPITVSCT